MGLSSSKKTTTTTQRPWVDPAMQANLTNFSNKATQFINSDPTQFVAPASELQNKAFADVQRLGGWQGTANQAMGMATTAANRAPAQAQAHTADFSALDPDSIQHFIDPQLQSYINATLGAYDDRTGRQRAAMEAQAAGAGAFGGSRHGIAQSQFEADAGRGRALTQADLMRQAYEQAVQTAVSEASRRQQNSQYNAGNLTQVSQGNAGLQEQAYLRALQGAGLLGDLSNNYAANARADVDLTGQLGAVQRGIASEYANAVPTQLQIGANLLGAIPPQAYIGQDGKEVSKSSPGLGSILGQIASSAAQAVAFSDRRLKVDVERIGAHGPLGLYHYRYAWDRPGRRPRRGVMADEVAIHAPRALAPEIAGFALVDYGKLGLAHLVEG